MSAGRASRRLRSTTAITGSATSARVALHQSNGLPMATTP